MHSWNRFLSPKLRAVGCGLLLGLSAPGYGLWIFAWVAMIPALMVIWQAQSNAERFRLGCCMGAGFGGLYYLWFFDLHPLSWLGFGNIESRLVTLAGWLLLTLETAVVVGLSMFLNGTIQTKWLRISLLPFIWLLCFGLLNLTPLALPWAQLAFTQSTLWPMRLLAGAGGASVLTLLLVAHNTGWACWLANHKRTLQSRGENTLSKLKPYLGPLLLPLLVSMMTVLPEPQLQSAPWPIPVAVIQGNLPIETIRSAALNDQAIINSYINPLKKCPWPQGTLLVYPEEGVAPGWARVNDPGKNRHLARLMQFSEQLHLYIAVGVSSIDPQQHHYNSLALISPEASSPFRPHVQFYHKRRLVPFGEFTPYQLGEALTQTLQRLNVDYSTPYDAGQASALLNAGPVKLGPLICFELIDDAPAVGGFAGQYQHQGADLLINSSNLGWFHQNPLLEAQFLAIGQLRAAETHLPLVIASNTGISAILSNQGKILQQTHPNRENQPHSQIIFYNGG